MTTLPLTGLAAAASRERLATRLPPFGKALQARGPGLVLVVPNTRDGWRTVRLHPRGDVLVFQLGRDPMTYGWPVKDCEVVLYTECLDERTRDRAVEALLRDRAAGVSCYAYRPACGAP